MFSLKDRKILVVGIANRASIAWGYAQAFRVQGADLAVMWHPVSSGPLAIRAAPGIDHFDELLDVAAERAPTHQLASINDVRAMAAFLASDEARNLTGGIHNIDSGLSVTTWRMDNYERHFELFDPSRRLFQLQPAYSGKSLQARPEAIGHHQYRDCCGGHNDIPTLDNRN
jgi:hypothetical protein